jgi:hypothetical protein
MGDRMAERVKEYSDHVPAVVRLGEEAICPIRNLPPPYAINVSAEQPGYVLQKAETRTKRGKVCMRIASPRERGSRGKADGQIFFKAGKACLDEVTRKR